MVSYASLCRLRVRGRTINFFKFAIDETLLTALSEGRTETGTKMSIRVHDEYGKATDSGSGDNVGSESAVETDTEPESSLSSTSVLAVGWTSQVPKGA
ncbi:hypothetical protein EVAR_22515_1 [Eumeta japonica]|uniref:Uncharacterized protein n=1 Tax=Eumeta variegata TaxID=151549 RepID=A0A4C1U7D7_EUMVA|nr:hypothetical protein EVAR_22515_1 [Eumeta japonica]